MTSHNFEAQLKQLSLASSSLLLVRLLLLQPHSPTCSPYSGHTNLLRVAGGRRSGQDLLGIPLSQLHPICVNVSQREARRLIPVALTSLFSTRAGLRSTSGPLGEAGGGPSLSRGAALMLFPASRPRVEEFQGGPPKSALRASTGQQKDVEFTGKARGSECFANEV